MPEPPADAPHELEAPTFRAVLRAGLPQFLREGSLPLGAFYVGLRLAGLVRASQRPLRPRVHRLGGRAAPARRRVRVRVVPVSALVPGGGLVQAGLRDRSVVWGVYLLGRAALRLAALLHGSVEDFLLITIATGTPAMLVLTACSIRYASPQPHRA